MSNIKEIIKKRMLLLIVCLIVTSSFFVCYINNNFIPVIIKYGQYKCSNIMTRIVTIVAYNQIDEKLKQKMIVENSEDKYIDFNVDILNSVASNIINKSQQILYKLEKGIIDELLLGDIDLNAEKKNLKKGLIYEIPLSMVFDNFLVSNIGVSIPLKFKIIGDIKGEIISSIEEYGINNGLLKIQLDISSRTKILAPMDKAKEEVLDISIPLVIKVIQGKVPDYYLGSNVIGGVE